METREDGDFLSPAILFFKGQISLGDNYQIDVDSEMAQREELLTQCASRARCSCLSTCVGL